MRRKTNWALNWNFLHFCKFCAFDTVSKVISTTAFAVRSTQITCCIFQLHIIFPKYNNLYGLYYFHPIYRVFGLIDTDLLELLHNCACLMDKNTKRHKYWEHTAQPLHTLHSLALALETLDFFDVFTRASFVCH